MLFYKVIASPLNLQMLLIHSLEIHLPLSMLTKNGKAKLFIKAWIHLGLYVYKT